MTEQPHPETNHSIPGDHVSDVRNHAALELGHAVGNANWSIADLDRQSRAARGRYRYSEQAITLLLEQMTSKPELDSYGLLATAEPENALFTRNGEISVPQIIDYLRAVSGPKRDRAPMDVLEDMNSQRLREERVQPAHEARQEFYRQAHVEEPGRGREVLGEVVEESAGSAPALPPGGGLAPVRLPQRVPGASMQAPPETAVESTGHIARRAIDELLKAGEGMSTSEAALAGLHPTAGPDYGPPVDPSFSASAVRVGVGDTQRMAPVVEPRNTQTLPPVKDDDEEAEPKIPFSGAASTAAAPRRRSGAESKGKASAGAGSKGADDAQS